MMTQKIIAIIDCRLREIKIKPNLYFGGISVILNGDPAQLHDFLNVEFSGMFC